MIMQVEEQTTHYLACAECGRRYPLGELRYRCECGAPLEIRREAGVGDAGISRELFDGRLGARRLPYASGVWRYRELLPPFADEHIISRPEGNTNLYPVGAGERGGLRRVGEYAGLESLYLKHEGENPTGSF